MEEEEFVLVARGARRCARGNSSAPRTHAHAAATPIGPALQRCARALEGSAWLEAVLALLRPLAPPEGWRVLRVLGVGRPSVSASAQWQTALAAALLTSGLLCPGAPAEAVDPAMDASECEALAALGLCADAGPVGPRELLFMPHCPAGLYACGWRAGRWGHR